METDSHGWLRLSSVPRRAFGDSPLPSDWYLGSPEFPGRKEGLPDGRVTGSLGTILPSGDPPFLYLSQLWPWVLGIHHSGKIC